MGKLVSTSSSRYKSSSESRQCPKQLQRLPLFMVVQDRGMSWVSDGTPAPHAIYLRVSRGFMMFHGLIWCNHVWSVQQASTDPSNCIEDVQSLNRLDHRLWEMISIQIITVIRTCLKILERTVYVKRFHWDILRLCVSCPFTRHGIIFCCRESPASWWEYLRVPQARPGFQLRR